MNNETNNETTLVVFKVDVKHPYESFELPTKMYLCKTNPNIKSDSSRLIFRKISILSDPSVFSFTLSDDRL